MHHFEYRGSELYCEEVPVVHVAKEVGTPFYLYSHATLKQHFGAFDGAFEGLKHLTCFSMKSNSNLAILRLFALEGGGADIVSGGELYRALKAGVAPTKIVYSGVGKKAEDLEYALKSEILMFNAESTQEILKLDDVARRLGKRARIAIRVNPDVDPKTHPYISTGLRENKFGVDINEAPKHYAVAAGLGNLEVVGTSCHIGSQLTQVSPFVDALKKLKQLMKQLLAEGIQICGRHQDGAGQVRSHPDTGAGEGSHRECRDTGDGSHLHQVNSGKDFFYRGCGHERPDAAEPLRFLSRHSTRQGSRPTEGHSGRGGAYLRIRRLFG
jgi:diaminopimelate decarboxylase